MKMHIAIIGSGYVGSAMAAYWKRAGYHVTCTTRKEENIPALKKICDDVFLLGSNTESDLKELLRTQHIVLLSAGADSLSAYESTYIDLTKAIVTTLKECPLVCTIIYTSSTSVYGDKKGYWVTEDSPATPDNRQGQILKEAEDILQKCASPLRKVCILRLGEIYGPGREITTRLKKLYGMPLPGMGGNYTNLIHLDDIVEAINFALVKPLSGIYNLCNDVHISRLKLYEGLCIREGIPHVTWDPSTAPIHGTNKRVSNEKMIAAGFRFQQNSLSSIV